MGYRIIYGQGPVLQKKRTGKARARTMIAFSFLIFAWAVRLSWPEGREVLAVHLLPGEPTLLQSAFSALLENLREGFGMRESLTVFCRELLYEIA